MGTESKKSTDDINALVVGVVMALGVLFLGFWFFGDSSHSYGKKAENQSRDFPVVYNEDYEL